MFSPSPDRIAAAAVEPAGDISPIEWIAERSSNLLAKSDVDPFAWQDLVVRARTWGWAELSEMPVDLRGPVRANDMFPP